MPGPALLADGATRVVQATEFINSGGISLKMDEQSKVASKINNECTCPPAQSFQADAMRIRYRTISSSLPYALGLKYLGFKPSYATEFVIGVDWEGNGCDITGAKPFLKSGAYAAYGVDVKVSCIAQQTSRTRPPACECCEAASCVKWDVSIEILPPLSANAFYSGVIMICADGEIGAAFR